MATIDVVNLDGEKVGSLELADEVFGAVNEDLLWEAVKHYRASLRAGTASTKTRGLVSGAGKKLWKQKGTGRARIASIRSPLWRYGPWTEAPLLRLRLPAQESAGRVALGAGGEVLRRQAGGGRKLRAERSQVEDLPRGAEQAEREGHDAASGKVHR